MSYSAFRIENQNDNWRSLIHGMMIICSAPLFAPPMLASL